ncbi:response regulator [Ktedonobacter robiniae]|nr:response regulator [Ktedonobacter robiniae]
MAQQKDLEQYSSGDHNSLQTILIVEDDVNIGEVLVQAISQETSYFAVFVQNGFEALKTVEGIKPSLFILDYHLPRMNGIELYDRLHAMPALVTIPAIMMSARLPQKELANRQILGMNKPIDLDEFLQAIEQLLE